MPGALVNLSNPGNYLHWGFIQLSVANGLVILLMIAVFVLALLIPFGPGRHQR
ncbi:MAG: hypothetical protein ACYDA2_07030 [Acidimicrobiales bacterium]